MSQASDMAVKIQKFNFLLALTITLVAALFTVPLAFILERDVRPKLTARMFAEIFGLSLLWVLALNLFAESLKYASATFVTAMLNSVSAMTFICAVCLRLETVALFNPRGLAKVTGTVVSLVGVMIMAFYKGLTVPNICHPLLHIQRSSAVTQNGLKGFLLTILSCLVLTLFYILQSFSQQWYAARLSLTAWISVVGAAQTAFFAALAVREAGAWKMGWGIKLWTEVYGGVVGSGLIIYAQLFCNKAKGPVFVTMFNPLSTILVAIISFFILGEKLYVGRIIGAVVVILGMYLFLWGIEEKPRSDGNNDEEPIPVSTNIEVPGVVFSTEAVANGANPSDVMVDVPNELVAANPPVPTEVTPPAIDLNIGIPGEGQAHPGLGGFIVEGDPYSMYTNHEGLPVRSDRDTHIQEAILNRIESDFNLARLDGDRVSENGSTNGMVEETNIILDLNLHVEVGDNLNVAVNVQNFSSNFDTSVNIPITSEVCSATKLSCAEIAVSSDAVLG
ncbi:WAT1-related protein At2g39510-like isoform X2 [Silene latifolia]|uniref:WAT1-related protein At2g39510-like isoform X2 n=2 Tax=Silene latifolia TaxID=37657 RepID=UPI003D77BE82